MYLNLYGQCVWFHLKGLGLGEKAGVASAGEADVDYDSLGDTPKPPGGIEALLEEVEEP